MRVKDRIAIVTGAADGIGRATAAVLAREGASVLCTDIEDESGEAAAKSIREAGGTALYRHCDVRSTQDAEAAVDFALSEFGRLDIMVANAGTVGGPAFARRMEDLSDEQWEFVIDVNLTGVFRCFRAAIPVLRRNGGGALSATASIAALTGVAGQSAYSASKGGIVALVRSLAYQLQPDGIRVNCVCPGAVNTLLVKREGTPPAPPVTEPSDGPVIGPGEPQQVANAHLFLVSDEASLVTGHALVTDGATMIANRWLITD
jgi:NAD(P)-dependent dehydrogenase (short-subunit alcohol dehydrogenase family)